MNSAHLDRTSTNFLRNWDNLQGTDCLNVRGTLYWPNGACRIADPGGQPVDPPEDPFLLAKAQLVYHVEKLRRLTIDFHEAKRIFESNLQCARRENTAGPGADEISQLRVAQTKVLDQRKIVEGLQAQVEKHTPKPLIDRVAMAADASRRRVEAEMAYASIKI